MPPEKCFRMKFRGVFLVWMHFGGMHCLQNMFLSTVTGLADFIYDKLQDEFWHVGFVFGEYGHKFCRQCIPPKCIHTRNTPRNFIRTHFSGGISCMDAFWGNTFSAKFISQFARNESNMP